MEKPKCIFLLARVFKQVISSFKQDKSSAYEIYIELPFYIETPSIWDSNVW